MTIDLLKDLTKLDIAEFEFEDLKNMENFSGYDFSIIKLKIILNNNYKESKREEANVYVKMIRKDKIKESIFCYWNLLYNENFKNYEESEFTRVVDKVRITETENEKYKHSILLQIKENKWRMLEHGSTIHLVKFQKYLNDNTIKKSNFTVDWGKYIEKDNEDVLFIGIVKETSCPNQVSLCH